MCPGSWALVRHMIQTGKLKTHCQCTSVACSPSARKHTVACKLGGWKNATPALPCPSACAKKNRWAIASTQVFWVLRERRVCKHVEVQPGRPGPSSWGQGAGAPSLLFSSLDQPALTSGVEWDSPWGDLGCHLWHLLPVQKNKSECSALGFLNSCPSAETRQSAKRRKGGGQGLGRGRRGGDGGGGQGRCFGGRRSSPGWGAGRVGDAQASGVPRMGVGVRGPRGRGYPPVDDNGRSRPLGGLGWGKVRMLGLVLVRSLEWGVGVRREGG